MLSQGEGWREEVAGMGGGVADGSKHVNGKINHQLQTFALLGLIS